MKLNYVFLLIGLSFFISSCEKEQDLIDEIESEEFDTNRLTYSAIIKSNQSDQIAIEKSNATIYSDWQKITYNDLKNLSRSAEINYLNLDDMLNRFTWSLRKGQRRPVSVSTNDYKIGFGTNPNSRFGWEAKFRAKGEIVSSNISQYTPWKAAKGTSIISYRNNSGETIWMAYPGEWIFSTYKETSWAVYGSITTEIGGKIGIPLFADSSVKISVMLGYERSGTEGSSLTEVIRTDVGQWVEPGKVINFSIDERHTTRKTEWSIPLEFTGYVSADYGKKRHYGHHFWAVPASKFFYDYTERDKKYTVEVQEEEKKEYRVKVWITDN